MGLYNFKARFVAKIKAGTKRHTIRAPRKRHEDRPGDTMFLYTGLRTRAAARIIEPATCVKVESIVIRTIEARVEVWLGPFSEKILDNAVQQGAAIFYPDHYGLSKLDADEMEALAIADGFEGFDGMSAFWGANPRFYGHVFHWRLH